MNLLRRLHPLVYFVLAVAVLPFVVHLLGSTYGLAAEALVTILVALSFNLLLGYTGQLSFGQAAYYGIGAYTAALLQLKLWPSSLAGVLLAPVVSALAAALVGALIIRKRGIYFALLTLAFAQVFFFIVFEWKGFTGGEFGLGGIARLPVMGFPIRSDLALYTFVSAVVIPAVFLLWRIVGSPFGRILQAIRDNEQRAACLGYNTRLYKFLSFVISGGFTGLAGGLFSLIFCYVSVDLLHWSTSGFAVMMTLIGGVQTFFGPAVGAFVFVLLKDLLSSFTENWMIPFGILFVAFVLFAPEGIGGLARAVTAGRRQKDVASAAPEAATHRGPAMPSQGKVPLDLPGVAAGPQMASAVTLGTVVLSAEGLVKRFGALSAVNKVSLEARVGELHSVIGPNGAGKTTLFNILTGILFPEEGSITLQGRKVTSDPSYLRIRQGLARSFQITSVFKNLTVLENVRIAVQAVSGHHFDFLSSAGALAGVRQRALELIKQAGLAGREEIVAGTLSHGEQRLLEIAITLATQPVVLLLDEPLAGLPDSERGRIASLIKQLASHYAVLLIEHDIDRVVEISDRVTVLHEGALIAAGSPQEIQENALVQQAYMGQTGKAAAAAPSRPAEIDTQAVLVLENVNSYYGHSQILHDVSLSVRAKEMACLLGRNGAGKTTTLRSIMGVVRPRSGRILMDKAEIQVLPVHQIAPLGISIVPEGARIFPNLKVSEHLSMAVRHGRKGPWNVARVFELMPKLDTLSDRRGEHLSGGERKMLAIARSLLSNPRLLLLDEPLEGLAPVMVEVILQVLSAMHGEMAILLVEQKASLALPLCESAYILNNGLMAYSGKSRELLADEPRLRQLLGV